MIRVDTKFHGIVELRIDKMGIAILRILQNHAPDMRVECQKQCGAWNGYLVPLSQLNLDHAVISVLNPTSWPRLVPDNNHRP